jgi:monoamine oxidase
LSHLFGSNDAHLPTEYVEQQWSSEEWSLGCPCPYTPPGVLTKVGEYLTEPHGHVHFVGTETAVEWKGYMEGGFDLRYQGSRRSGEAPERCRSITCVLAVGLHLILTSETLCYSSVDTST